MTRYFEVLRRDGPARAGKLQLERGIDTPGIISREDYVSLGSVFSFGSLEEAERAVGETEAGKGRLLIMPHVPSPPHWEPPIDVPDFEIEGPKGVVVHPFHKEVVEADVCVLGGLASLSRQRDLVAALTGVREKTAPDTALYAPAAAAPFNLALMVYLGVDLVDNTKMVMDGFYGRYHTRDGTWPLESLHELPCRCKSCQALASDELASDEHGKIETYELLAAHNTLKLEEELANLREVIRKEGMREYVERQVRVTPHLTSALRVLDQEGRYLERRTPTFRRAPLYANTAESLHRVEVVRFAKRVLNRYRAPEADVLLLLPCSARKPYSRSRSHRRFAYALGRRQRFVHELILTSPLALVPRELEEVYPAASYDVPVTGRWDLEERAWLLRCLDEYLERNRYSKIVAHIDGELREAVEEHGVDAVYTGGGTDDESLTRLVEAVDEACQGAARLGDYRLRTFRAKADYHFGRGAADLLLAGGVRVKGREVQDTEGRPLASETVNGNLAITLEGARRLLPLERYVVNLDDFFPQGSILAPGVAGADEGIRPGDEVIVMGKKAFGVGRARMAGWEMVSSKRGVAVELRRVEKA